MTAEGTPGQATFAEAAAALAATPFFAGLSPVALARLVPELEERHLQTDEIVFRQGDPGDGLYLIRTGTAGVSAVAEGGAQIVAMLVAPAYFGEMALLSDEPRSATIVALTPMALWKLPNERFRALVEQYPALPLQLAAEVTRRLAETTRKLSASQQEIAEISQAAFDSLEEGARSLLCRAALLTEFDTHLLREAFPAAWSPEDFESVRGSVFWHMAGEPGRYRFVHEPVRELLLDRLLDEVGPDGLSELRRLTADVLLKRGETQLLEIGGFATPSGTPRAPTNVLGDAADDGYQAGHRAPAAVPGLMPGATDTLGLSRVRSLIPPRRMAALGILLLIAGGWAVPPPGGLSEAALRVMVTVLGTLGLSLLGVLPEYLLGLLMIGAWVISGTLPPRVATAGFAASTWFLLLASMAIGTAIARSGLLYRGALEIVRRLPPSHTVRCLTLAVLGVVFSPGMPSVASRVSLAVPLAQDIADSLRYPPRGGGSAGLALATYVGFGMMGSLFLTGSALCLILYGLFPPEVQAQMTWGAWFLAALPTHLVLFALTMAFLLIHFRPERDNGVRVETLALQRQVLGRLSRDEWSALTILTVLLLGFSTQSIHRIDPAWLAVLATAALFLTGALDDATFRDGVNWSFLLYLGLILGFGEIFAYVELDRWLGRNLAMLASLTAGSSTAAVMATAAITALLGLVLSAGPVSIVLSLALYPLAASLGVSPWVLAITILLTSNLWLYPQQNLLYLTAYYGTGERAFSHVQVRPLAIAYGVFVFVSLLVSIPYWRWLGLVT